MSKASEKVFEELTKQLDQMSPRRPTTLYVYTAQREAIEKARAASNRKAKKVNPEKVVEFTEYKGIPVRVVRK